MNKVSKIFITHMHVDHIMGIVPLLRNVLLPPLDMTPIQSTSTQPRPRTIEIFGPAGLRLFVRQVMKMTITRTLDNYVVHELLTPEDPITPCEPRPSDSSPTDQHTLDPNILHSSELVGFDIRPSPDGFWRAITQAQGVLSPIVVDAGSILHRDPCIGYTFTEVEYPSRKLVILGDTYDPSAMVPLCINPSPSLLIHEATDSPISPQADPTGKLSKRSAKDVHTKALSRGHSTPEMAGAFAKLIGARDLVLNHIGGRFPAPRNPKDYGRHKIMQDIERKASIAWDSGKQARAAWDFLRVHISYHPREEDIEMPAVENAAPGPSNVIVVEATASVAITQANRYARGGGRPRGGNRPDKRIADRSDPSAPNDAKRRR
ncbi:beta-lactamase-like protein [Pholiota molesta]|nr:beta-lactamase-like protein [Pholiota molesta]